MIKVIIVLLIFCLGSSAKAEDGQIPKGDFIYIEGNVQIREKDSTEWIQVSEDTAVSEGAVIKLENNSYAEVSLDENKKMEINEETMVGINSKGSKTSLDVIYGSLRAKVKKIPDEEMEIRTPVAVAAVRGTEFAVIHEEEDTAEVEVFDGEVAFKREDDTEEIRVTKDQWAKAGKDLKAKVIGKITAKRELRWKHLKFKRELFLNLRAVKRNKIQILRLGKMYRITRDPDKKKTVKEKLDKLIQENEILEKDLADKKKVITKIKRQYITQRTKKSPARRKLIEKRKKQIIERKIKKRLGD